MGVLGKEQGRIVWAASGKCTGRNCLAGQGDPKDLKFLPAGPGQRDATFRMAISGFIGLGGGTGNMGLSAESWQVVAKCLSLPPTPSEDDS